ncbi:cysteine hydrolase [Rhodococcus triatomae]|nr:cysteine hydrolase [Rhodococcus triatomae]QNG25702.1 cysteine hydrolase [Rhodococcus triatomae]
MTQPAVPGAAQRRTRGRNAWQLDPEHVDLRRAALEAEPIEIDARPQRITMDLSRTALVVVDMQNDFCHRDGWLSGIGVDVTPARAPITPLRSLIPSLRDRGVPIVWVNWGNRPDRANLPPGVLHVYDPAGSGVGIGSRANAAGAPVLERGSWSAAIVDELVQEPWDVCVDKYRMSGFVDTPLDSILRNLRVDTLLFAGVNADQCVLATLADAADLGYDVVMLTDAVGTTSPEFCMEATVYNVRQCYGFTAESGAFTG